MANPFEGLDPDSVLRELQQEAANLEAKAAELRTELANATKPTQPRKDHDE